MVSKAGQSGGFTLVEVMVATAIVGIALALALPNFLQWQARYQLRQAASEVATQLTLARMAAMNRNRSVDVTVQNSGGRVNVSAITSSGSASILNEAVQSNGTSVIGSPVTVSFSSLGMRTNGVQTIGICNDQKLQYSVTIIPMGKVDWSTNPSATPCS